MGQKRRIYVPEITGEFAKEQQILSRAREFFLILIQRHTPTPLYGLREDVLPKYRAAFHLEIETGRSRAEVEMLACRASVDAVLADETEGLGSSKEFQDAVGLHRGLYDASVALIDWSKRFNLQGKRTNLDQIADPDALRSARIDALWPLFAGLETILHWHFAPAGWLSERRNPPCWRPPISSFRETPVPPDPLPLIQLKSTVQWQPTSAEDREAVKTLHDEAERRVLDVYSSDAAGEQSPMSTADLEREHDRCIAGLSAILDDLGAQMERYPKESEIDAYDWFLGVETEPEFRKRLRDNFDDWLDRHVAERKKSAELLGLVEVPGPRESIHFVWAAKYQVEGVEASRIVTECENQNIHISESAVKDAIQRVLNTLRLEKRPGKRGPKAQKSLRGSRVPR